MRTRLTTAICTPLNNDFSLHVPGLEAHLEDQWRCGIHGILIGGTMGLMQLQTDSTYRELVAESVRMSRGRGELLVGVGDTSFARTRDRIRLVEQFDIDGVVVLSPYLLKFSQDELVEYFLALADISSKPLYLYDLPAFTGTKLELETLAKLAGHRNLRGIKCSGAWEDTRQVIDRVGDQLRVIPAQPQLIDQLVRMGISENLDGIFGIAPCWATNAVIAAEKEDWQIAASFQQKISGLLRLLRGTYTVFGGCEAINNAREIPGRLAPSGMQRLDTTRRDKFLAEPLIRELLEENRAT